MEKINKKWIEIDGKNGYLIGIIEIKGIIIWFHGFGNSKESPKIHRFAEIIVV